MRVIGPQRIGAAVMRLLECTACALKEEAIYKSRKPSPVIRTIQEYPGDLSPEEGHRVTYGPDHWGRFARLINRFLLECTGRALK